MIFRLNKNKEYIPEKFTYFWPCESSFSDDDYDVSLMSLFHACTGQTVAPLQLPVSQSFQPHHQTSTSVFKY